MAMREWTQRRRTLTCDKCGHVEDEGDFTKAVSIRDSDWTHVMFTVPVDPPTPDSPLGQIGKGGFKKEMLICMGCRGMFEAFFEIKMDTPPTQSAGVAAARPILQMSPTQAIQAAQHSTRRKP